MDVFEAIRTLLAVREYEQRPVPEAVIARILEAGRLSGSAGNKQPWHFVVVQHPDTVRQLAAASPSGPYIAGAPLAIVVIVEPRRIALADGGRAIQNMLLAAWAEGVGGNWVRPGETAEVKGQLGIPEDVDVLAILPFGYPARAVGKGEKKRKPLAEIAHRERWGTQFDDPGYEREPS